MDTSETLLTDIPLPRDSDDAHEEAHSGGTKTNRKVLMRVAAAAVMSQIIPTSDIASLIPIPQGIAQALVRVVLLMIAFFLSKWII